MPDAATPTLQRLMLGEELRHIRETHGKTIEQVSQELSERLGSGFSTAKISRLETAKRGITLRDVRDLCEYYGLGAADRERLLAMAKASRDDRNRLQGLSKALLEYVALESIASSVCAYESMLVPGLLQTRDYTRALAEGIAGLVAGGAPPDAATLEEQLDVRATRQDRLRGPDPMRFIAIMDENVVRRRVGAPGVMAAQLRRIVEVSEYPNVTILVVPIEAGAYAGFESAGFSVLEFPDTLQRPPACFLEGTVGSLWAERDADRQRIIRMIDDMQDIALSPEQTRALLTEAARSLAD